MLLNHDLKDLFTSFITSKKSISKRSNFIIDERIIIDEDIIDDQNVTTNDDIIIDDQDISADDDIIEDIDIIEKQDIIAEDDTIDENDIIEKQDTIDEDDTIDENDIIEEQNTIRTTRMKFFEDNQTNVCDCWKLDELWKNDLQKHDQNVHEDQSALLLFASINYINWIICDEHHKILKNAFKLRNHSVRRILTNRMNKIWRRRWNIASVKRKHFIWFIWKSWRAESWILVFSSTKNALLFLKFFWSSERLFWLSVTWRQKKNFSFWKHWFLCWLIVVFLFERNSSWVDDFETFH